MTENELTGLLLKLADLGVTGIKIKYDGAGDSGAIEWIGYTTQPCETPEDVDNRIDNWLVESDLSTFDSDLYYEIEHFAESKLLETQFEITFFNNCSSTLSPTPGICKKPFAMISPIAVATTALATKSVV